MLRSEAAQRQHPIGEYSMQTLIDSLRVHSENITHTIDIYNILRFETHLKDYKQDSQTQTKYSNTVISILDTIPTIEISHQSTLRHPRKLVPHTPHSWRAGGGSAVTANGSGYPYFISVLIQRMSHQTSHVTEIDPSIFIL